MVIVEKDPLSLYDTFLWGVRNWLVSYPRSGNTWVRLLFASLLFPDEAPSYKAVDYTVPDLHSIDRWNFHKIHERTQRLLLVKSHHPILPHYFLKKTIYLFRDPRDVVISEYYFEKWHSNLEVSFEEFLELFISGRMRFESWNAHMIFWLQFSKSPEYVHIVKYENIYDNPVEELKTMCRFLNFNATDDEIRAAVEKCEFERCRPFAEAEAVHSYKLGMRGKPGGWREVLSQEQQDKIWDWAGKTMTEVGYER